MEAHDWPVLSIIPLVAILNPASNPLQFRIA